MAKLDREVSTYWNALSMNHTSTRLASTTKIVAAFLANNKLGVDQVADLLISIDASFIRAPAEPDARQSDAPLPPSAATVRKSIRQEYLISFEDGCAYKMLKRHLSSRGLTPEAYRAKWGLPGDYPMVAPAYSAVRSEVAQRIGLGRGGRRRPEGTTGKALSAAAPRPRGRPPKVKTAQPGPAEVKRARPSSPMASTRTRAAVSRPKTNTAKAKSSGRKPKR